MVIGIFNDAITCGAACWHAEQDKCVCSCGGVNHGLLKPDFHGQVTGEQPVRTKRVRNWRYRLITVCTNMSDARIFCRQRGHRYVKGSIDKFTSEPPKFLVNRVTDRQLRNWPECADFERGHSAFVSAHIVWALEGWDVPAPVACAVCGALDAPERFKEVSHRTLGADSDTLRANPGLRNHRITHADFACASYWPKYWRPARSRFRLP